MSVNRFFPVSTTGDAMPLLSLAISRSLRLLLLLINIFIINIRQMMHSLLMSTYPPDTMDMSGYDSMDMTPLLSYGCSRFLWRERLSVKSVQILQQIVCLVALLILSVSTYCGGIKYFLQALFLYIFRNCIFPTKKC